MDPTPAEPLATDRLILAPLTQGDVVELYQIARDPASIEDFYTAATSITDTQKFVDETIECKDPSWTVRLGNAIVGFITLEHDGTSAEAGYFLSAPEAGNGYTTEALIAVVEWAFEHGGYGRIKVGVTDGNAASSRVAEKAGMTHYKTNRQDWEWKGETFDSHYYEILKAN